MTYISVPVPSWEPVGESPLRAIGVQSVPAPQHQRGQGDARGSLVSSIRITDTEQEYPPILNRKASDICLKALEKLESLPYNDNNKKYESLCQEFYEYLDMCEQKKFILRGYDVVEGKLKNFPMDYDNRWFIGMREELSRKLDRLEAWFSLQVNRSVTMITLTSEQEGLTITGQWVELNKSRLKLVKLLRKYFGDIDYFWVVEPHKTGYVHYHLAVFADVSNNKKDNKGKGIEDKFRDLWSRKYKTGSHTYGLDFSQKKGDDKLRSLKNYLSKYLRKGFLMDEWSIGMLLFNAHLWSTGFRMYGASKRISSIMKLPEKRQKNIVWLETRYQDIEKTLEGEKIETERVIWARQYIPDWIDSSFVWYRDGIGLGHEPDDTVKLYDWGKRYNGLKGYDPTHGVVKCV